MKKSYISFQFFETTSHIDIRDPLCNHMIENGDKMGENVTYI